jgi:predicted metalloprotease
MAPYQNYYPRDFALSVIVAHEWAHHLQSFMGLDGPVRSIELQADCLAGVWAFATWPHSLVSTADVDETFSLLHQAGSSAASPDRNHGSVASRLRWFNRGWNSGRPGRCVVPA